MLTVLRKFSNAFFNSSMVSSQQGADEILCNAMVVFSIGNFVIYTNVTEKRIWIRKSEREMEEMDDNDTNFAKEEFIEAS